MAVFAHVYKVTTSYPSEPETSNVVQGNLVLTSKQMSLFWVLFQDAKTNWWVLPAKLSAFAPAVLIVSVLRVFHAVPNVIPRAQTTMLTLDFVDTTHY